ncbi:MAG: ADP-ribosylglycohydrolase family protein, partial [Pirellulaceae bacterium]
IPAESQYAEMVRDVLAWYEKNPDDWKKTWEWIEAKYHKDPNYSHRLCSGPGEKGEFSIDAKLNGAYILMGMLYGKGDLDQTIVISTQCGQDSDCNPANSGGILFTTIGFSKLPDRFTSALDPEGKFSHTPYDFPTLVDVSAKIVRQAVKRSGGRVETDAGGEEVLVIPVLEPQPSTLERSSDPGPVANSRFTDAEMSKIVFGSD